MVWPNRGAISVIGGYGLNVLKLLQGGHRCCRYASVRLQQGSEDYPATPSTIARILCRGPGQARLGLAPLPFSQRRMERRAAQPSVQRLAALPRLARARIATRRSIGGFSVPGAVLPWGATQANQPATGAASAARRRPSVQPSKAAGPSAGGRLAEASRPCGYEPQRRAPHPAPPSGSSLEDAPPSSRT